MRSPWKALGLVALVAGLLALGGCGEDDSETVPSPVAAPRADAGVSHEEFVERVNEICVERNAGGEALNAEGERLAAAEDYEGLADLYDKVLSDSERNTRELVELTPPAEDKAAFTRYVRSIERQEGLLARFSTALRAEDGDAGRLLRESIDANSRQRITAAIDLGADKCGKP